MLCVTQEVQMLQRAEHAVIVHSARVALRSKRLAALALRIAQGAAHHQDIEVAEGEAQGAFAVGDHVCAQSPACVVDLHLSPKLSPT